VPKKRFTDVKGKTAGGTAEVKFTLAVDCGKRAFNLSRTESKTIAMKRNTTS
jgi:hypothetical protein